MILLFAKFISEIFWKRPITSGNLVKKLKEISKLVKLHLIWDKFVEVNSSYGNLFILFFDMFKIDKFGRDKIIRGKVSIKFLDKFN